MNASLKLPLLQDQDLDGKRVVVRVDFNVPMQGGVITDDTRIREALPTLQYLVDKDCKVVLLAHMGRPKGKPQPEFSLKPVARALEGLLGQQVFFAPDCVGPEAAKVVAALGPGAVALLENVRFHAEEKSNDEAFAKALAAHGEFFVQDAFGAVHRADASTAGIPKFLPGAAGLLVQKEVEYLHGAIDDPKRPFVAVIGGAKVADKIGVLDKLVEKVDALLIGGGMAYTFLAAQGIEIGDSLFEEDKIEAAKSVVAKAYARGAEVLLPADHIIADKFDAKAKVKTTQTMAVPEGWMGLDIGEHSVELFRERILGAKTVFWNGPLGVFEMAPFSNGSFEVARAVSEATEAGTTTILGGGDTLAVLQKLGEPWHVSHCSTGGGASLKLMEGANLPGLAALQH